MKEAKKVKTKEQVGWERRIHRYNGRQMEVSISNASQERKNKENSQTDKGRKYVIQTLL